ncbi:DEKNAAC100462 [Brettanomyces naardenensis]|uniref:Very-long-chain (3R)-3-hydroxyacyl-CoA dehydratase n=1 Tax=Brettanomyces naardenensis TaxID=13370 RepID=A0A448YFA3_BRENA|nr:DEKNAAC100462 [Brettanomyces naardenensis]
MSAETVSRESDGSGELKSSSMASSSPSGHSSAPSSPAWVVNYNLVSGSLWSFIFIDTVFTAILFGQPQMFDLTSTWLTLIQSGAIVEMYNSAVGNVRSPLFTTVMQVASRFLLIFGIFQALPYSPANYHWSYITLSLAWSVSEIIRYYYYAAKTLSHGNPPRALTYLRYNAFTILYPIGISSEVFIVYSSLDEAAYVYGPLYKYFLIACLISYIPGAYILYSHMLKQRSKVLKQLANEKAIKKAE